LKSAKKASESFLVDGIQLLFDNSPNVFGALSIMAVMCVEELLRHSRQFELSGELKSIKKLGSEGDGQK
jgi:hypothetical protein